MNEILEVRDERFTTVVTSDDITRVAGGFEFLEGPVWNSQEECLIFSDIAGDRMHRWSPELGVSIYREPSNKANGNAYDHAGRLITCEHATSRVVRQNSDGSTSVIASMFDGLELNSPNDVIVAGDGRIIFSDPIFGRKEFFGIPRPDSQPTNAVYGIDPSRDESPMRICEGFDQPNGLCLSLDEQYLYVNDTPRMHIKRFPFGPGHLGEGEVWAEVAGIGDGAPDGMKIDSLGHLFCTGPGGIQIFAIDGTCLGVIRTPERVANFNWGGRDLQTLFMCGRTSLYSIHLEVPGRTLTR